jgi:hypothetical protein
MSIDLAADGARTRASDADKRAIADLAERARYLEETIAELEAAAAVHAKEMRMILTDLLPQAMLAVRMKKFELEDGSAVNIKDVVRASIPKPKSEEALDWLRDNGHGDLIKNVLVVTVDRGKDNVVAAIKDAAIKLGVEEENLETKTSVHPQTLSAFCRDMLERGADVPSDLLGLYVGKEAVIKTPKEGKTNG